MKDLVVLVGASGVGKTTVARILATRDAWRGRVHHFDAIGVPSPEEMESGWGDGDAWQAWATREWVDRLAEMEGPQLLEAQTRPTTVLDAVDAHAGLRARVVVLDCDPDVRRRRLSGERGQPELADDRMDRWAAYLVGQAHALDLPVVDTSRSTPEEVARTVESHIAGDGAPRGR